MGWSNAGWQSDESGWYKNAASGYTASAVSMNAGFGMKRGAALTGVVDSKVGTLSFWYKPHAGTDAQTHRLLQSDSVKNTILIDRLATTGDMRVIATNFADSVVVSFNSNAAFLVANGWRHFLASWNLATSSFWCYVNDAADSATPTLVNDTIAYATSGNIGWWAASNEGLPADGDIADLWFDTGVVFSSGLDLSNTTNRRKFISAGGAPVDLGSNGSTPGGIIPPIYVSGPAAGFTTNKGSGGGFTLNAGSVSDASTHP